MLKYQWTTHTKMLTIYLIEDCVHVNEQTLLSNFNSKSILIFSSSNNKKSSLNSMLYIPRHIFKIRYKTSFPSGYSMRLRAVWNGMEGECCYFSVFPIQKIDDFWKIEQNHKWKSIFDEITKEMPVFDDITDEKYSTFEEISHEEERRHLLQPQYCTY